MRKEKNIEIITKIKVENIEIKTKRKSMRELKNIKLKIKIK